MKSINIWKGRPNKSGSGSRGNLASFKIDYINKFIKDNKIKSILDFGCGDLHISSKLEVDKYFGIDIVDHIHPQIIKAKDYKTTVSRFDEFEHSEKADLCLCMDVLYHILSDELEYLENSINKIVDYSSKYVIIYAQDSYNKSYSDWSGHMNNSPWRQILEKKVTLISEQDSPLAGTTAKFYVYEKR